jgi:hypothetical protein
LTIDPTPSRAWLLTTGPSERANLALSKLERNTQRDRDDVKHFAQTVPLDLDVLKERYQKELRPYLGNPEREDLTLKLWIEIIEEERSSRSL